MPQSLLVQYRREHEECLRQNRLQDPGPTPKAIQEELRRQYFRKIERYLDNGVGACWLARADIATVASEALRHFEGERYLLSAWVIMPNHIHAVLWPMPNHTISRILQSWKGFIACQANRFLNRSGEGFWQHESYDHWIRNDEEQARFCQYVIDNPVNARLCLRAEEWRWSSAWSGWRKK